MAITKAGVLQVFDEQGRQVQFIGGHPSSFSVDNLPSGLYVVSATTVEGQHLFQKLMVKR